MRISDWSSDVCSSDLTAGATSDYARDDAHRAELEASVFKGKKVEIGRFKGLGEMNPNQLKETTMDPATRAMLRVTLPQEYEERHLVKDLVDRLMGKHPEHRFQFIQANAARLDAAALDARGWTQTGSAHVETQATNAPNV